MDGILKSQTALLPRSYYVSKVKEFVCEDPELILGKLTLNSEFPVDQPTRDAWLEQIRILKQSLIGVSGTLFLEFNIPRMGRRIDAVLIAGPVVFVIEFKVGEKEYKREAIDQVWDYALDLKNFHKASHNTPVLPILLATLAASSDAYLPTPYRDRVYPPVRSNSAGLCHIIDAALNSVTGNQIDPDEWGASSYHPTPTIIEAAKTLYARHSVDEIARNDAGARNLRVTSQRIERIVNESRLCGWKSICFVTGVPGAGKTLVGLNAATRWQDAETASHSVFLSGNGPLVAVLREALTRDKIGRERALGRVVRKGKVFESVKSFIQNVHHFRDEALRETKPPIDHVVIFDEAQRAWNLEKTSYFMRTKKKNPNFLSSEPEFLISYMDRHENWAVIICLVGGGQEINTGEAGIGAWLDAINTAFPEWRVYISPELTDNEYAAGHAIDTISERTSVYFDKDLHLAVSMRSFRAENVSEFVKALLDCDVKMAGNALEKFKSRYPIAITRNIDSARSWIREHARGSERYGLVASSEAQRLKPHAIDIRVNTDPVHWFLNDRCDTRSSYYLEDVATEFQIQGLELDWVCATWDGDLRFKGDTWSYHSFCGCNWRNIRKPERQNYLLNAYRVLLTRARQGMVIFVPKGVNEDPTRKADYYDPTFNYLCSMGIPCID